MAEKLGDAYVDLGTRDMGLTTGLNKGLKAVQTFAVAASVAFAGIAAGRGITGLVGAYSDAEETINKFNEVFSGSAQDINKAADELAESYGLIGSSSRKLLADTGDILVGFGFAEDAALDLSIQTNKLAVDLASFTNIEGGAARASQALTKALVGESESAKALGVSIRQDTAEYKARTKELIEVEGKTLLQAKALQALEIAAAQSRKAQGDYARTEEELANQMRLTGERVKALKEATGGLLVQFLGAREGVAGFNNQLERLAGTLNSVTSAQIKTTKEIVLFTAAVAAAYKGGKLLIPVVTTLAAKVSALAASGGLAAAIGPTAGLTAAAAGIAAIVFELVKMRHATNELVESQEILNDLLDRSDKAVRDSQHGRASAHASCEPCRRPERRRVSPWRRRWRSGRCRLIRCGRTTASAKLPVRVFRERNPQYPDIARKRGHWREAAQGAWPNQQRDSGTRCKARRGSGRSVI